MSEQIGGIHRETLKRMMRELLPEILEEQNAANPPTPPRKKLLTAQEVSELTGWHINHIYRLIRQGKLSKVPNLGREVRFDPELIQEIVEKGLQRSAA